jgi:hypothetical protein
MKALGQLVHHLLLVSSVHTFCRWLKMMLMGYRISISRTGRPGVKVDIPEPSLFFHSSWLMFTVVRIARGVNDVRY